MVKLVIFILGSNEGGFAKAGYFTPSRTMNVTVILKTFYKKENDDVLKKKNNEVLKTAALAGLLGVGFNIIDLTPNEQNPNTVCFIGLRIDFFESSKPFFIPIDDREIKVSYDLKEDVEKLPNDFLKLVFSNINNSGPTNWSSYA